MEHSQISLKKSHWKVQGRLLNFNTSLESDWKIIFVSTTTLLVLIVALSIFMFIKIDKGDIFVIKKPSVETIKALDTALLKETVSYYQNKALEFESIINTPVTVPDPSV